MILAWSSNRRTRQAARHNDFSRRKPVAVRTTSATSSAQPEQRGRFAQPATESWVPGSLRSARHRWWPDVNTAVQAARTKRLWIRLTSEEAAHVASIARARGMTRSAFVRKVALRSSGLQSSVKRRPLQGGEATGTIRQLSAIAANLHQLLAFARTNGTMPHDEIRACLDEVRATIGGFAR